MYKKGTVYRLFSLFTCIGLICGMLLCGCQKKAGLDPKNPVTITLWHNFGGQMLATMDELVDEFNSTLGKETGIQLNVTSVSGSAILQEKLTMAANGDPGAPVLPDITTCYPNTALTLQQKGLLVNLDEAFTREELSAYLPRFVEEGRLADGGLYVFPFAKSTEVLFLNQTLFDRFAAETGATLEQLSTFEGLAQAAVTYYDWADAQTPDIPGDGKAFYMPDSWFNIAQVGMAQLGASLIQDASIDYDSPVFSRVFDPLFYAAAKGAIVIADSYSSELSKTGEIICSTGSTAGILFYGDSITYADNTTEEVTYTILPYPVFEGGKKVAIQRGSGMCITRSTPEKELAAATFLKWFTAPEQNMKFISSTGYLPVTIAAFGESMQQEIDAVENQNIKKLLTAATTMYADYDFYIPPTFDGFHDLDSAYQKQLQACILSAREAYQASGYQQAVLDTQLALTKQALRSAQS